MRDISAPVSIVLCTYNGERHLEAQLNSLRVQAGVAEIVVTDDRSTDRTVEILRQHAALDTRIKIHVNSVTLGVTANFERGMSLATAPWIALADQDDVWVTDKLQRMRDAWDGESCLMHHASLKFRGTPPGDASRAAHNSRKFHGRDWRRLLYRNSVVGHTVVVRRELVATLRPFPAGIPHDWWLGVGAAVHGQVQYLDEHLVFYRIHERNAYHATGSRWRRMREDHALRLGLLRVLTEETSWPMAERHFAEKYLDLLEKSQMGIFPLNLWRFYLRNSSVLFAGVHTVSPGASCVRRSFSAVVTTMFQRPPAVGASAPKSVFQ